MNKQNNEFSCFYKKSYSERIDLIKKHVSLQDHEIVLLQRLFADINNDVVTSAENRISFLPVPLGIATNFIINGKEVIIPMAIEEPSVIAGASYAAKLACSCGGFKATATDAIMIGQLLLTDVEHFSAACQKIITEKTTIIERANLVDTVLISCGGGVRDIQVKTYQTQRGQFLVLYILVDVQDAMGANIVNSMLEQIAPFIIDLVGGVARTKIISNLAVHRMVKVSCEWDKDVLGQDVVEAILDVYEFACCDPFRAVTHNKGIMNGIDAVALATGNDFRALEAGAHGFAAYSCSYRPLTKYYLNEKKNLVGELEIPLAVGIVGGATKSNKIANVCLKLLQVTSASALAEIMASVGLAQNFAALRALASEGIQRGHMRLHSKNIAINAGVPAELVDDIAQQMVVDENISCEYAQMLVKRRLGLL
jgi:hydroxymethylglutaryl-CoA reductase